MFAFDRRRIDLDGRLHCTVPISKSNVSEYLGSEIPDWQSLRLSPTRTYRLYRDPVELKRAASSFNNLPLLATHQPVSATDYAPNLVIGSIGTDAKFTDPYLKASIVVWAQDAISAIANGSQKQLSCAYRYQAQMVPGLTPRGERFDGTMKNIVGNHVALVNEGRAGSDVCLDQKPRDTFRTFTRRFPDAARIGAV